MSDRIIKIQDRKGNISEALIHYQIENNKCLLSFTKEGMNSITETGNNFFECLCKVRLELEAIDYIILCQGATKDVYPSRMAAQMSNGLKAYKLTLGKQASLSDLVDIFAPAELTDISSVKDQKQYFEMWLKSLSK
jgi:hypothetical protein